MSLFEIFHQVAYRNNAERFRDFFERKKRRRQQDLRFPQPKLAQVLARTGPCFVFEKMAKTGRRKIYERRERVSVPRA